MPLLRKAGFLECFLRSPSGEAPFRRPICPRTFIITSRLNSVPRAIVWYSFAVSKKVSHKIIVLLHNIRSVHNVGAIFRTADAIGVSEILLSGYTPTPLDHFGKVRSDFKKTSLGAELQVPWRKVSSISREILRFKKEGCTVVGVEQDVRALHYRKLKVPEHTVILLGNEVRGLSHALRAACDSLIEIPMRGKKESLNVSVAAGIILYGLFDRF